jgi:hypothetical protein
VQSTSVPLRPTFVVINPLTNVVEQNPGVQEAYPFTVRGENLAAGHYGFYIVNRNGQQLGTTFVGSNGNFISTLKWPRGVYGSHQVIAYDTDKGQIVTALTINGFILPH